MLHSAFLRLRRWVRRRPTAAHWMVVLAIAGVAALGMAAANQSASNAAASWGEPVAVLQAQVPLLAGSVPGAGTVAITNVPSHLVPSDVLVDPAQLGTLTRLVPAGALLTAADLAAPTGVPPGLLGVGVAAPPNAPTVSAGTALRLLLFGNVDPYDVQVEAPQSVPATLLAADEERWVVAVAPGTVEAVATADVSGRIVPVLAPGLG